MTRWVLLHDLCYQLWSLPMLHVGLRRYRRSACCASTAGAEHITREHWLSAWELRLCSSVLRAPAHLTLRRCYCGTARHFSLQNSYCQRSYCPSLARWGCHGLRRLSPDTGVLVLFQFIYHRNTCSALRAIKCLPTYIKRFISVLSAVYIFFVHNFFQVSWSMSWVEMFQTVSFITRTIWFCVCAGMATLKGTSIKNHFYFICFIHGHDFVRGLFGYGTIFLIYPLKFLIASLLFQ